MPDWISYALAGHSRGKDAHAGYKKVREGSLGERAKWLARIDPLKS